MRAVRIRITSLTSLRQQSNSDIAPARASATIEKTIGHIQKTAAYKSLAETTVDALDDSETVKDVSFEEKGL